MTKTIPFWPGERVAIMDRDDDMPIHNGDPMDECTECGQWQDTPSCGSDYVCECPIAETHTHTPECDAAWDMVTIPFWPGERVAVMDRDDDMPIFGVVVLYYGSGYIVRIPTNAGKSCDMHANSYDVFAWDSRNDLINTI